MKQGVAVIFTVAIILVACGGGQNDSGSGDSGQNPADNAGLVPYRVPDYPKPDDFTYKVYIDPDAADGGDGSIENPYNHWDDVTGALQSDTAYLFKAGTYHFDTGGINDNFNDNYVGMYGAGEKPILESDYGSVITLKDTTSTNVVFENLHFTRFGKADVALQLVRMFDGHGNPGVVFANNIFEGVDTGEGYPAYCMKGSADFAIIYHNEFKYSANDGVYGGVWENASIVSNYFHHNNMDGVESLESTGDNFQIEGGYVTNAYLANNYMVRHGSYWKFSFIVNSLLERATNFTAEYNTFVGPENSDAGGAAVRWLGGADNTFRKNLLDTTTGIPGLAGYIQHLVQEDPYGARDNHFVGTGDLWAEGDDSELDPSNFKFETWADYNQYLADNGIVRYDSDIDPDNFWGN